jgi:predicted TIM-barrel fold metal-dependent hydrolase
MAVQHASFKRECEAMTAHRVDVHHHFMPRRYMLEEQGRSPGYGHGNTSAQQLTSWTPSTSVAVMDEYSIACAIGSVTTPGVWFGDVPAARRLSREWNEAAAGAVQDHPGRFGFFAVIAPPDVDGALREVEYALDTLGADGIGLLSNYDGNSLGDPAFAPVFEELNRRGCVVYVHPTMHPCTAALIPGVMPQAVEFPLDTVRTITSMAFNGTFARSRNVRFIFAHGGGALPFLAARIAHVGQMEAFRNNNPDGVEHELRRLYCDTAFASSKPQMASILQFFPESHVLFGSDYPFSLPAVGIDDLTAYPLADAMRAAIDTENALALFPRLGRP